LLGEGLADRLGEHEAHVLLDDLELLDVLGPARPEEGDKALDELLGGAGARGDADDALALQPALLDLAGVVDEVRIGPVVADFWLRRRRIGKRRQRKGRQRELYSSGQRLFSGAKAALYPPCFPPFEWASVR